MAYASANTRRIFWYNPLIGRKIYEIQPALSLVNETTADSIVSLYYAATMSNVVGSSAQQYNLLFDTAQYDPLSQYDIATGTFTAADSAWYDIQLRISLGGLNANHGQYTVQATYGPLASSVPITFVNLGNIGAQRATGNYFVGTYSSTIYLAATDLFGSLSVMASGLSGADQTVDIGSGKAFFPQ